MKTLCIFLLSCVGLLSAQNRFQYQLTFKIDSLNRDFVQEEVFNLDFYDNKSLFYPEPFAKMDSVVAKGGRINGSKIPDPKLDYVVSKNHLTGETTFQEAVGMMMFSVPEPRAINWKISNETQKYKEYTLQKATTTFAGRNWTAWFCQEIPVLDGPYKFKGLPGLIFNLEDDKKDYVFELIGIQKLEKPTQLDFFSKLGMAPKPISYEKFSKVKKSFMENPAGFFRQIPGFSELPPEELNALSETYVNREKKQNNKIERSF